MEFCNRDKNKLKCLCDNVFPTVVLITFFLLGPVIIPREKLKYDFSASVTKIVLWARNLSIMVKMSAPRVGVPGLDSRFLCWPQLLLRHTWEAAVMDQITGLLQLTWETQIGSWLWPISIHCGHLRNKSVGRNSLFFPSASQEIKSKIIKKSNINLRQLQTIYWELSGDYK